MTKFHITAAPDINSDERQVFIYDNLSGTLTDPSGQMIGTPGETFTPAATFTAQSGLKKSRQITLLKIQMGLSCNYECGYCSQRFVPHADETSVKHIESFLEKLNNLDLSHLKKIEFWGGEPFVYWKTMKPLAEALRERLPDVNFSTITNGSLLDDEKVDWMDRLGFSFSISHDGPAQYIRGPDPLDDPVTKRFWQYLWVRFGKQGRMSFNAMLHGKGASRADIFDFFRELTGDPGVIVGEGGIIDAYDEGGLELSLQTKADHFNFRRQAFTDMLTRPDMNFPVIPLKVNGWIDGVKHQRPAEIMGQKCGMDSEHSIAIDLMGDVITCQNVSSVAIAPNGESHNGGNIVDMDNVKLKTATHWANRDHCTACPVLQLCSGSCMFLEGEKWDVSCGNSYSDNIVMMSYAFFGLTKMFIESIKPIDGVLPDERMDIWGQLMQHVEIPKRRIITIKGI